MCCEQLRWHSSADASQPHRMRLTAITGSLASSCAYSNMGGGDVERSRHSCAAMSLHSGQAAHAVWLRCLRMTMETSSIRCPTDRNHIPVALHPSKTLLRHICTFPPQLASSRRIRPRLCALSPNITDPSLQRKYWRRAASRRSISFFHCAATSATL